MSDERNVRRAWQARCDEPARRRYDALRAELDRARHDVAEAERVVLAIATQCADELVALAEQTGEPAEARHREHTAAVQKQLVAAVSTLRRQRHRLSDARVRNENAENRRPIVESAGAFAYRALEQLATTDARLKLALSHDPFCACSSCDYAAPIVERLVAEAERAIAGGTLP
jgi:hypothetical protein